MRPALPAAARCVHVCIEVDVVLVELVIRLEIGGSPGGDDVQQIIHFLVSGTDCSSECFCGDVRNRYRKCLLRTGRLFCCKGRRRLDIRVRNFDDCFSLFRCFVFGYVERDDPCGFGIDVRYPTVVAFGRQGRICDGVFDRVFDLERSSFGWNIEALFGEYDFRLCIRCDGIVVVTPGKERGTQNPPPKIINNHTNLKYFIV